jgi:hypothetical protein
MRTALWQIVKRAFPNLTDQEVEQVLHDAAVHERRLILSGIPLHQAREIAREEMFEGVDPWAGDDQYGPTR